MDGSISPFAQKKVRRTSGGVKGERGVVLDVVFKYPVGVI